jgi:hypothetical protein
VLDSHQYYIYPGTKKYQLVLEEIGMNKNEEEKEWKYSNNLSTKTLNLRNQGMRN